MQRMNWKSPLRKQPCVAPFVEHLQKYTEEKDQMIFFTCAVLLSHRGLSLNKINVFCLLITDYDIKKNEN